MAVALPATEDQLTEQRYVVVILRLRVDQGQELITGEVIMVADPTRRRFLGWRGLERALRTMLNGKQDGLR